MKEIWLKDNNLIKEKEWKKEIGKLKSKEIIKDKKEARKKLKELLFKAVEKRAPEKRFGVFFSGGVDSSLIASICKKLKKNFVCYTIGFQERGMKEPEDITEAKKVAKRLGLKLKYKIYSLKEAEEIIKSVVNILKEKDKVDVVNVGVGGVVLAASELGKKEEITYFFSGLGSEEIFAGYERHGKVKEVNKECWKGLKGMWLRDLVRDFSLGKKVRVEIRTPFLDKELIKYGMKIPAEWKLNEEEKKVILREVAEEFLGKSAWRKKKAAQYGSGFDKAIEKLARKEGFKSKKEWLEKIKGKD